MYMKLSTDPNRKTVSVKFSKFSNQKIIPTTTAVLLLDTTVRQNNKNHIFK